MVTQIERKLPAGLDRHSKTISSITHENINIVSKVKSNQFENRIRAFNKQIFDIKQQSFEQT